MNRFMTLPSMFFLGLVLILNSAQAAEVDRGQLLYENHCGGCHDSKAHLREDKLVKNLVDLSKQVIRWQYAQKLNWEYDDVIQVTRYLNQEFYHFRLPNE